MFLKPYPLFECPSGDGRNFVIRSGTLDYVAKNGTYYRVEEGTETDGGSTPAIVWSLYPPFGVEWLGYVLHDAAYGGRIWIKHGKDSWQRMQLQKDECDLLLKEALEVSFVSKTSVFVIYNAVRLGAGKAFDDDLTKPIKM